MPISFKKLFMLMDKKEITIYRLRKDGVVGTATLDKMRKEEGHVDTRSIESLCKYLGCQPGDIMEYVAETKKEPGK